MNVAASVVVPVHNADATLGDQLGALAQQRDAPEFEVVVVLNRCTDRSRTVADSFRDRLKLTIATADDKGSVAYARNVGAATGLSQVLLFCDADDRVSPRWVAAMVEELATGEADFVGGCPIVDHTQLPDWAYARFYSWLEGPKLLPYEAILYPLGASWGITRSAFESVEGFDENFKAAGMDEVDMAVRLFRRGYRVGLARDARFLYRPRTTVRGIARQQRNYARGYEQFLLKEQVSIDRGSVVRNLGRATRRTRSAMVREKEWRPRALAAFAMREWARADVFRTLEQQVLRRDKPPVAEFVVPLSVPVIGGRALRARADLAGWYATVGVEPVSLHLLTALVRRGQVFVDCGANIGMFSVCAALQVGASGRVISFEPDPRTRELLVENAQRHGVADRVTVFSQALGSEPSRLCFNQYSWDVVSGFLEAPAVFSPGEISKLEVDVVRLDDVVDVPVDLMKIDVEGFELAVLEGARGLLERSPDVILLVELNPVILREMGRNPEALLAEFPSNRWVTWLIDEKAATAGSKIRRLDDAVRSDIETMGDDWYGNLLVVPHHRQEEVHAAISRLCAA